MKPLFIHIPKTGGMSIRHGLRGRVVEAGAKSHRSKGYTEAVRKHMAERGEHHGFEHARWMDVSDRLKDGPAFAVVRNPWARTASRYFFALHVVSSRGTAWRNYQDITNFDSFLAERHVWGEEPYYWHRAVRGWYPQMEYVTDERGVLQCDILRTEHLGEDVQAYLGVALPRRRNVTPNSMPYKDLYTPEQIQVVADWYSRDIEFFHFDFDTGARRNVWAS